MSTPADSNKPLFSRRRFIQSSALAAAGTGLLPGCTSTGQAPAFTRFKSPNEKLNIGIIGTGGKGDSDAAGVAAENIVALCDVDENTLRKAAQKYPGAKLYRDYRKMLQEMKEIDAVTVSTPDHHHFPASMLAIKSGKHVFCQKPLTHSIWEARQLTLAARKHKVATQMGNQGHSGEGNRVLCEMIWAGMIGQVREVHSWTNRPIWPQGQERPQGEMPVPANLDWDLWIGPAPMRPYNKGYHPFAWRGFWDFGCGALGDMGCHVMDGPVWSLKLGHPTSVEMLESSGVNSETAPKSSIIRYEFPARGDMIPVRLVWYDGGKKPEIPQEMENKKLPESGSIFIGDRGKLVTGTYGENPKLLPESKMNDVKMPPPTIPRSAGHVKDWLNACKGGKPASSNFDVAGPFTEVVLLGNLALRVPKKLEWDGPAMKVKNAPEAARYIHKEYRRGWQV